MLLYDLYSGLAIFDFKWEGWEQITFSLAKLMTIMHMAFTGDNGWLANSLRGSSANLSIMFLSRQCQAIISSKNELNIVLKLHEFCSSINERKLFPPLINFGSKSTVYLWRNLLQNKEVWLSVESQMTNLNTFLSITYLQFFLYFVIF